MFSIDLFAKGKKTDTEKESIENTKAQESMLEKVKKIEAEFSKNHLHNFDEGEKNETESVSPSSLFLDQQDITLNQDIILNQQEREETSKGNTEDENPAVKSFEEGGEKKSQTKFEDNNKGFDERNDKEFKEGEENKEGKSLLGVISSLKAEKKENESKIKKLTDEKEKLKKLESTVMQELLEVKKEKEDLSSNISALKEIQIDNEKEIKKLMEESSLLEELKVKTEETDKFISEVVKIIGIKTDDLGDFKDHAFATNCLNRLKEQMDTIET